MLDFFLSVFGYKYVKFYVQKGQDILIREFVNESHSPLVSTTEILDYPFF